MKKKKYSDHYLDQLCDCGCGKTIRQIENINKAIILRLKKKKRIK